MQVHRVDILTRDPVDVILAGLGAAGELPGGKPA